MIVVWRVTEHCNLACRFCAFDRDLDRPRCESDPNRVLAFGRVLGDYAHSTGEAVLVSWLGGEPFLWQPLRDISEAFHRRFGLSVSATTNGSLLRSRELRAQLLERYAELTISVDGMGATHEALRGWPGGYAEIRRGIRALVEEKWRLGRGPRLLANVVLMRNNFAEFETLCIELASWGVKMVTFNQLGGNDRPEFYPEHCLLPHQADQLAAELPRWRAQLATRGLQLLGGRKYLRRIQSSTRGAKLAIEDCHAGKGFLFIDETGRVAPCSYVVGDCGVPVEEIDSVAALRALGRHFASERSRKLPVACMDCHSNQVFDKFVGAP
jgi:AdoMet-dependent heme synthase